MLRVLTTYSILLLLLTGISSCDELLSVDIVGDGNLKTEGRSLGTFDRLYLESDFEVVLKNGDLSVVVEADSNLLSYVLTEVTDEELDISVKPNFKIIPRQRKVHVYVTVPQSFSGIDIINGGKVVADSLIVNSLDVQVYGVSSFFSDTIYCPHLKLETEGSTSVDINGSFEELSVRQRGSGNLNLSGISDVSEVVLEGSGKINAKSMKMQDTDIRLYGSGLIFCRVNGLLNAMISGSGRIYYYGDPSELKKEITGKGLILPGEG
jgi:hypothetical protein